MSEYWVSKKKYFCKYCEIYISDDAPSRQQHENGLRHKGNTERFIRSIYKAGEKKKKDEEEERREMARVEQAAQIAFAQDVGAGRAKLAGSSSSAPPAPPPQRKPPTKPSNPWANYSTAQSLGYEDPDAERIAIAKTQGTAGAWEVVAPEAPAAVAADAGTKRSAEELGEEEAREFKLRKRTITTGLGEIYDPGAITIKLKKREETSEESRFTPAGVVLPTTEPAPPAIKWEKRQWKKVSEPSVLPNQSPHPQ
ncbi:unnamed protein product [Mycena citricolor]|uniref:Matrin-type domain-containing protein n=1 Tax=Mycena citricolor TaxID=2018698 RepID=A0AAD2HSS5_9AGAR|nr:unnamed protein product [Mycena citricolor]